MKIQELHTYSDRGYRRLHVARLTFFLPVSLSRLSLHFHKDDVHWSNAPSSANIALREKNSRSSEIVVLDRATALATSKILFNDYFETLRMLHEAQNDALCHSWEADSRGRVSCLRIILLVYPIGMRACDQNSATLCIIPVEAWRIVLVVTEKIKGKCLLSKVALILWCDLDETINTRLYFSTSQWPTFSVITSEGILALKDE